MIKIMFICHGNICRSPMAEFVLKDMVNKRGLESSFYICSSATSTEEIGNGVHYGTRNKLKEVGILTDGKYAVQLKAEDYNNFDYLIAMDEQNISNIFKIFDSSKKDKVYKLLDFTNRKGNIADPWYTGNFDVTYNDIYEGCEALLEYILENNKEKL